MGDTAVAACAAFAGQVCYVISSNISFIKATKNGILTAECRRVAPHHRIENYIVEIKNEDGETISTMSAIIYKKDYFMNGEGVVQKTNNKK